MAIEGSEDSSSTISQMFSSGNKISIVKLGDDNFPLWKFQVIITLEGYDLDKYVQFESTPPSEFITMMSEANNTEAASIYSTQNLIHKPEYNKWKC